MPHIPSEESMRKAGFVLIFLLLVAIVVVALVTSNPSDATGTETGDTDVVPNRIEPSTPSQQSTAEREGPRPAKQSTSSGAAPSTAGRLIVHVVWHDGASAPGVGIRCSGRYPHRLPGGRQLRISDEEGRAIFEGLGARKVSLASYRGGSAKAETFSDRDSEVTLKLPKGIDVHGKVLDPSGAPVANAAVWMTTGWKNWLGGRVVARSDASGEFQVRAVKKRESLGAFAPGYERSAFVDLETLDISKPPVLLELKLLPGGGSVKVRVVDAKQEPVEGARVAIGKMPRRFRQRTGFGRVETWTPRIVETDAAGVATAHGFPTGMVPLVVRHDDHPIWQGQIEVAVGRTTEQIVTLGEGVVVHGVARDGAGAPVARAVVRAIPDEFDEQFIQSGQFDYEAVLGYPMTTTDADGRYRLDTVAPGQIHLHAQMQRKTGGLSRTMFRTKKSLRAPPGTTIEWDPVLAAGHTIRGVVTYRDGTPMRHVFVTATVQDTGKENVTTADAKGRFQIVNLEQRAYIVSVQLWSPPKGTKPLKRNDVWPDQAELQMSVDYDAPVKKKPGSVRGQLQDAAKRIKNPSALHIMLVSKKMSWRTSDKSPEGKFHFKGVQPGRYRVAAKSGEDLIFLGDWFDLAENENMDIGVLWTKPAGSLELSVRRHQGAKEIEPTVYMRPEGSLHATQLNLGVASEIRNDNLLPGKYRVTMYARGMLSQREEVTIEAGRMSRLQLELKRAARVKLRVFKPASVDDALRIYVTDATGKEVWKTEQPSSYTLPRPWVLTCSVPPGKMTLHAKAGALHASRPFVAKLTDRVSKDADLPIVELRLR